MTFSPSEKFFNANLCPAGMSSFNVISIPSTERYSPVSYTHLVLFYDDADFDSYSICYHLFPS